MFVIAHLLCFSVVCACITYFDSAYVIGFCNGTFDCCMAFLCFRRPILQHGFHYI